ncbi:hypothetical protein H8B15_02845 [Hymenobacter sp. BT507]|uniref:Uncharacterized protein n=1 Tax=Hymenobacter citatus TaxID=2763506 RepID=A0ABR7MFJ2_9BACT|nr:hypothetical protein [Hymenobacter citatus]MBC6609842.1 hypothetical protein [Hymenobacter citatus]
MLHRKAVDVFSLVKENTNEGFISFARAYGNTKWLHAPFLYLQQLALLRMRLFPLPWLKEKLYSPLTPDEIVERLKTVVHFTTSWSDLFWTKATAPFEGKLAHKSFSFQRATLARASYLPQITGRISSDQVQGGSTVLLCHRLGWAVLVLNSLWLLGIGLVTLFAGLVAGASSFFWMVLGLFVLSVLLFTVPFWLEVRKSRPMLMKLLKLQAVSE